MELLWCETDAGEKPRIRLSSGSSACSMDALHRPPREAHGEVLHRMVYLNPNFLLDSSDVSYRLSSHGGICRELSMTNVTIIILGTFCCLGY